jgi:alpha-tubulin suppressor-like RCC1 family protein
MIYKPSEIFRAFDNKGTIKMILAGKKHMIFLNDEGKLFSYGYGEFGALGLGTCLTY